MRTFWMLAACLNLALIDAVQPAHAGATEWMDIRIVEGFILVETEVAGVTGFSMIDTGASIEAINANFLEANDLKFKKDRKITLEGVFEKREVSSYREISASVFGSPVVFTRLIELDLGAPDIQLLIGSNFVDNYIFQFDYVNERMRLITRDALDLKAIRNVEAKLDRGNDKLLVRVGLEEDEETWLAMDTGSNGGVLINRSLASRLDWLDNYERVTGTAGGALGSGDMEYFRAPLITVGPFELENVLVAIPVAGGSTELFDNPAETGSRIASRKRSAGLLGYDVLKHFVVTIDYDRGHVHFYPGEKIPAD
jgi:hypothetical protein